jgi:hypothetical protein
VLSGIDLFLAKSLSLKIKNNLDANTQQKLKLKLFKKYGYSIKQSIVDFSKLDKELLEFLKSNTIKFEKFCITEIVDFEEIKKSSLVMTIKDELLIKQILEMVGDKESRKILEQVAKKPLSVPEILEICKLSKTSGYRKINNLNRNGYLVRTGFEFTSKKRAVDKYTMFWEKIIIEMKEGTYIVKIKISKKIFNNSSVIQTIYKNGL